MYIKTIYTVIGTTMNRLSVGVKDFTKGKDIVCEESIQSVTASYMITIVDDFCLQVGSHEVVVQEHVQCVREAADLLLMAPQILVDLLC